MQAMKSRQSAKSLNCDSNSTAATRHDIAFPFGNFLKSETTFEKFVLPLSKSMTAKIQSQSFL